MKETKRHGSGIKRLLTIGLSLIMVIFTAGCNSMDNNKPEDYNGNLEFVWDEDVTASAVSKAQSLNMLTATDDFGRTFDPVSGAKTDKDRYVGLFYFVWQGQHGGQQSDAYDISKMLEDGSEELWSTSTNEVSPIGQYHYWGKPLYGYYNSSDEWVIRKHIELLTMAGVDFLVMDATNGFEYSEVSNVILPILQEYFDAGWNVPKVVFYTNSISATVVKRLYQGYDTKDPDKSDIYNHGIYKDGRYRDLWFCPNGKPMIIGITEKNGGASDQGLSAAITDKTLLDFFEIKESQWPNTGKDNPNGFPWVQFTRPNYAQGDVINVSVAQHNRLPFSDAVLSSEINNLMWGRGYTTANGANHSRAAVESGLNFEEQWDVAKQADVKYTFVTGWNEWIALKSVGDPGNGLGMRAFFVDTFNKEYSRDVEMMEGGYFDNFYLQMTRNIRGLKSAQLSNPARPEHKTIDIAAGLKQWNEVNSVYYDFSGETIKRDSKGISNNQHYTDESNRNDIEEIRVASDKDNIYFMVKCKENITVDLSGGNWMNILIDVNGVSGGWKGYNYLINRSPKDNGLTTVDKITEKSGKPVYASGGNAYVTMNGKFMQYKIPKSALGIKGEYRIDFKVLDNVQDMTNLASFYTTGDVAPGGRVNYAYYGK